MVRNSSKVTNCLSPELYIHKIRKVLDTTTDR